METQVFANFSDYWFYARHFTNKQIQAILRTLPPSQREAIETSYQKEGWEDLFLRNRLDAIVDEISEEFHWNLLHVRCLVLRGEVVYVKKPFWEYVNKKFKGFSPKHLFYIFGGYRAVETKSSNDEYKLVPVEEK